MVRGDGFERDDDYDLVERGSDKPRGSIPADADTAYDTYSDDPNQTALAELSVVKPKGP